MSGRLLKRMALGAAAMVILLVALQLIGSILDNWPVLVLAVILGAVYFASRSQSRANARLAGQEYAGRGQLATDRWEDDEDEDPGFDAGQRVADMALRRAGNDPDQLPVRLTDIGLLLYRGGAQPSNIMRDEPIRQDATHIRPYIRLAYPLRQVGGDNLRFELVDSDGRIRYQDQSWYDLKPGENFLTPPTWFPLSKQTLNGGWTLRVTAGQTPLAVHNVRWKAQPKINSDVRAALRSDGELDDQAVAKSLNLGLGRAAKAPNEPLSLDELLADQPPAARSEASGRRH